MYLPAISYWPVREESGCMPDVAAGAGGCLNQVVGDWGKCRTAGAGAGRVAVLVTTGVSGCNEFEHFDTDDLVGFIVVDTDAGGDFDGFDDGGVVEVEVEDERGGERALWSVVSLEHWTVPYGDDISILGNQLRFGDQGENDLSNIAGRKNLFQNAFKVCLTLSIPLTLIY